MTFGEAAARLSGAASLLLGWRADEFWNATPTELALALDRGERAVGGPDLKTIQALQNRFPDKLKD
jgi:hypothetical protein